MCRQVVQLVMSGSTLFSYSLNPTCLLITKAWFIISIIYNPNLGSNVPREEQYKYNQVYNYNIFLMSSFNHITVPLKATADQE